MCGSVCLVWDVTVSGGGCWVCDVAVSSGGGPLV